MLAVTRRVANLEKQIGVQEGKLVVIKAGPNNDDLDAELADNGIDADDPKHLIIILRTFYEDRSGGLAAIQPKAQILYTMDRR